MALKSREEIEKPRVSPSGIPPLGQRARVIHYTTKAPEAGGDSAVCGRKEGKDMQVTPTMPSTDGR